MISLLNGNALQIPLSDNSVHCVITSPPYWGLRDYGINGQLGLEQTPEEFIANMVAVFREVRRVLRADGTLWLNFGDCFATSSNGRSAADTKAIGNDDRTFRDKPFSTVVSGLKPKDMVGIPWRVAFALQADGWYLRSDIIWHKPNPMPESVTDRPTKSHEYVFLMAKSERYFYDADAVMEKADYDGRHDTVMKGSNKYKNGFIPPGQPVQTVYARGHERWPNQIDGVPGRNRRTVWTIPTQGYSGAHFATYPPGLVEPCIKAGTSEYGVCPSCGAPWRRVVKTEGGSTGKSWHDHSKDDVFGNRTNSEAKAMTGYKRTQLGWQPTCECHGHFEEIKVQESWAARATGTHDKKLVYIPDDDAPDPVPATVFDPFVGSGTTLLVARQLGRNGVGLDLSYSYLHEQARERLGLAQLQRWTDGNAPAAETPLDGLPMFDKPPGD